MTSPQRPPVIPGGALWIGLVGLLPFFGSALLMLSADATWAQAGFAGFVIYAATMLSFFGGVRWGLELARQPDRPDTTKLGYAALTAVAGWALAFIVLDRPELRGASGVFAGLFALQHVWDRTSVRDGGAPAWYPLLREVLTGGVMLSCLILIMARSLGRF